MYVRLHVKCLLLLPDFNQIGKCRQILETSQLRFQKNTSEAVALSLAARRTDTHDKASSSYSLCERT
jgi:hypothetical protein